MTIITMTDVTDAQRRAVAQFLGRADLASREEVRAFLQQRGQEALDALQLPLVAAVGSAPARRAHLRAQERA